jgi:hypothetical protein
MNVVEDDAALLDDRVVKDTVKRLERLLPGLRRAADLEGLAQVKAQADRVAAVSGGRTRRRAERLAEKALTAASQVRAAGGESAEERAERVASEAREVRLSAERATTALLGRLGALLHLLLYERSPVAPSFAGLASMAATDGDGFMRVVIPEFIRARSPVLVDGFDRGREIFEHNGQKVRSAEVERALKTTAVGLVSSGAELRGLSTDAVPLVAYAFVVGALPSAVDSSDEAARRVDDLVLSASDEISTLPGEARPVFITLLRLSTLLGEADAYAERHRVRSLTFA